MFQGIQKIIFTRYHGQVCDVLANRVADAEALTFRQQRWAPKSLWLKERKAQLPESWKVAESGPREPLYGWVK